MPALLLLVLASLSYFLAYFTYGRFISRRIFSVDFKRKTPATDLKDDQDYVPTRRMVIFGHHFTSIAGTGPIVGPAIGIIWGWVPAVLWVIFGSIFVGAVHDFAALKISLRNQGKSISEITAKYISPKVRLLFFIIVFFALLVVLAIFGLVIAIVFSRFPQAVFPIWMQIPIALFLGVMVNKKGRNLTRYTFFAVVLMYITIIIGKYLPLSMPALFGIPSTGVWTIILLIYAFIASTLPVTTLLQPRDYINAWQLYIALGLMVVGIIGTALVKPLIIVAPAFQLNPVGAPPILPFLFITIACGAISGFHGLVASGTSAKQVQTEKDAQFVGYGSMLIESFLAIIVIIAVTAGLGLAYQTASGEVLTGAAAWSTHYSSWSASAGLSAKIEAVVIGASNLIASVGIPTDIGVILLGVFIASFAGTTLDSATRIQRYIISEICTQSRQFSWLGKVYPATGFAIITAVILAFSSGANGKGALALWPLFGSINQLLAVLTLLVASVYLKRKGGLRWLSTALPCLLMLVMTIWGALINQVSFMTQQNGLLIGINFLVFILAFGVLIESVIALKKK